RALPVTVDASTAAAFFSRFPRLGDRLEDHSPRLGGSGAREEVVGQDGGEGSGGEVRGEAAGDVGFGRGAEREVEVHGGGGAGRGCAEFAGRRVAGAAVGAVAVAAGVDDV